MIPRIFSFITAIQSHLSHLTCYCCYCNYAFIIVIYLFLVIMPFQLFRLCLLFVACRLPLPSLCYYYSFLLLFLCSICKVIEFYARNNKLKQRKNGELRVTFVRSAAGHPPTDQPLRAFSFRRVRILFLLPWLEYEYPRSSRFMPLIKRIFFHQFNFI